jgi:hypothetical protein
MVSNDAPAHHQPTLPNAVAETSAPQAATERPVLNADEQRALVRAKAREAENRLKVSLRSATDAFRAFEAADGPFVSADADDAEFDAARARIATMLDRYTAFETELRSASRRLGDELLAGGVAHGMALGASLGFDRAVGTASLLELATDQQRIARKYADYLEVLSDLRGRWRYNEDGAVSLDPDVPDELRDRYNKAADALAEGFAEQGSD